MSADQLDVNDVLKHMRELAGEQTQQIAMLRAALTAAEKARTEPNEVPEPKPRPVPPPVTR